MPVLYHQAATLKLAEGCNRRSQKPPSPKWGFRQLKGLSAGLPRTRVGYIRVHEKSPFSYKWKLPAHPLLQGGGGIQPKPL